MNAAQLRRRRKDLGKRVAFLRKRRGLTQEDLAERMNMSVSAVSYVENGDRGMTTDTLYKLADALRVEVRELF